MTQERWAIITTYKNFIFDGKYEVSNWGNIRNAETKKPLATYSNQKGQGYLKTKIIDIDGIRRAVYIHHLVAFYFLEERANDFDEVDHIDGNTRNNSFSNLRYLSHSDNMKALVEARRKAC